ncbi:MAG TPA: hypothetical protein PKH39_10450 [Woeseiaceae bacterium]|nr:hypothetical protein [Woeseiaceae bacterium]
MQEMNGYPGPRPDDYDNVLALNTAFIKASSELRGPQRGRLAATPFLLFSLREDDMEWWRQALATESQPDLIGHADRHTPLLHCVQIAALSFLWQLAQKNPYTVRVVSGATIAWCDAISELPLLTLLDRVGGRTDLIQSRLDTPDTIADRLLGPGTSASKTLRRSSQLCALQTLLTRTPSERPAELSSAACNLSGPLRIFHKKV